MNKGFFKVQRRFFEHDLWREKRVFSKAEAWLDTLRSAHFEDRNKRILVGNTRVDIERGEWAVSIRFLAERWGWSRHKVTNFTEYLELENMINVRTVEGTQQTIVTICNYDTYNSLIDYTGTDAGTPRGHHGDSCGDSCGDSKISGNNKNIKELHGNDMNVGDSNGDTFIAKKGTKKKNKEDSSSICNSNNSISSGKILNAREEKKSTPTWRTDFEIYKAGLREAYKALLRDADFFTTQQKFYPTLDIKLTLEKACTNFWATEAGWKHKKKQRSNDIDWKATLTNALSQPQNKVFKNEQRNNKADNKPSAEYKADILRRLGVDPGTGEAF